MPALVNCWGLTCEIRLLGKQGLGRKQVCLHTQFLVMNLWCAGCILAEGYTGFQSNHCKLASVLGSDIEISHLLGFSWGLITFLI